MKIDRAPMLCGTGNGVAVGQRNNPFKQFYECPPILVVLDAMMLMIYLALALALATSDNRKM